MLLAKRTRRPAILEPLPPRLKWRAITLATLLLVPGFWALLAGFVSGATDESVPSTDAPNAAAGLALGLALIPFVFIVLAFLSEHPRAPGAVLKAMGLTVLVGVAVSFIAVDVVTGVIAGVGAGGTVALRKDPAHSYRARAIAVGIAALYTFILVRTLGAAALLPAPIFPLMAIGIADHLSERRYERATAGAGSTMRVD